MGEIKAMTLELTDKNFEALVLNNPKPAVIDFWTQWCAPCKTVGEAIETLAEEYKELAVIGKVDADVNPEVSLKFRVRNMPTVLYLKDGKVVDKQVGAVSKAVLEEKLKAIL